MITVRQMERLWNSKGHDRIVHELLGVRAEWSMRLESALAPAPAAAALLLIRLDELSQSHVPLYATLVKSLVQHQQVDGGWGDPITTALALRALLCGGGGGFAVERGLNYLAALQKEDGSWPVEPLRRMPADAYVSAFVMSQLGDRAEFREAVRFASAWQWLDGSRDALDPAARKLWELARVRGRFTPAMASGAAGAGHVYLWS